MNKCKYCGTTVDMRHKKGFICRPCYNKIHVARMVERRIQWKNFLLDNVKMVCKTCGYDKSISAIDFHHKDPSKKDFAIGNWTNGRFAFNKKNQQLVLQEINKCDILCSNCHRELHSLLSNSKIN